MAPAMTRPTVSRALGTRHRGGLGYQIGRGSRDRHVRVVEFLQQPHSHGFVGFLFRTMMVNGVPVVLS